MKTNEAPDKIYIQSFNVREEDAKFERLLYFDDIWTEKPEPGIENIEYTRTDSFIEKAEKFLEDNLTEKDCKFSWGEWTKVKSGDTPIASFMREFRNYMKGESKV